MAIPLNLRLKLFMIFKVSELFACAADLRSNEINEIALGAKRFGELGHQVRQFWRIRKRKQTLQCSADRSRFTS